MAREVEGPPASAGDIMRCEFDPWVGKIPLEKEMVTHSSILAWEIPWTLSTYKLINTVINYTVNHSLFCYVYICLTVCSFSFGKDFLLSAIVWSGTIIAPSRLKTLNKGVK